MSNNSVFDIDWNRLKSIQAKRGKLRGSDHLIVFSSEKLVPYRTDLNELLGGSIGNIGKQIELTQAKIEVIQSNATKKLELLDDSINTLNDRQLPDLQDELDDLDLRIDTLTDKLGDLDQYSGTLAAHINTMDDNITTLDNNLDALSTNIGDLSQYQGTLAEELNGLNDDLDNKLDDTPGVITETYIGDNAISVGKLKVNNIFGNSAVLDTITGQQGFFDNLISSTLWASTATFDSSFINKITSNQGFFNNLTASELWANSATFSDAFVNNLTGSQGFFDNLVASGLWANTATFNEAFIDNIVGNSAFFNKLVTSSLWSDTATFNQAFVDVFTSNQIFTDEVVSNTILGGNAYFTGSVGVGQVRNVLIDPNPTFSFATPVSGTPQSYSSLNFVSGGDYQGTKWTSSTFQAQSDGILAFYLDFSGSVQQLSELYEVTAVFFIYNEDSNERVSETTFTIQNTELSSKPFTKKLNVKTSVEAGTNYSLSARITANFTNIDDLSATPSKEEFIPKTYLTETGIFFSPTDDEISRLGSGGSGGGGGTISTVTNWDNITNNPFDGKTPSDFLYDGAYASELHGHLNIKYTDNANHYGYINFTDSSGVRGGYIGYGNAGNEINLQVDNATHWNVIDGGFKVQGNTVWDEGSLSNPAETTGATFTGAVTFNVSNALTLNGPSDSDYKLLFKENGASAVSFLYEGSAGGGTSNKFHIYSEITDESILSTDLGGNFTIPNQLNLKKLRLTSAADAGLLSTDHGFQIGPTSGNNIAMDGNEIMARNDGSAETLYLNFEGGDVYVNTNKAIYDTYTNPSFSGLTVSIGNLNLPNGKIRDDSGWVWLTPDNGGQFRVGPSGSSDSIEVYMNRITDFDIFADNFEVHGKATFERLFADQFTVNIFKPNTIRGMGGEFIFNATSTVSEGHEHSGGDYYFITVDDAVFGLNDDVVISGKDDNGYYDLYGHFSYKSDADTFHILGTNGTQTSDFSRFQEGDTIIKVDGNPIHVNANASDANTPYIDFYQGLANFTNGPFDSNPEPIMRLGNGMSAFNSNLSGSIGLAGNVNGNLAFAITENEGKIGNSYFDDTGVWGTNDPTKPDKVDSQWMLDDGGYRMKADTHNINRIRWIDGPLTGNQDLIYDIYGYADGNTNKGIVRVQGGSGIDSELYLTAGTIKHQGHAEFNFESTFNDLATFDDIARFNDEIRLNDQNSISILAHSNKQVNVSGLNVVALEPQGIEAGLYSMVTSGTQGTLSQLVLVKNLSDTYNVYVRDANSGSTGNIYTPNSDNAFTISPRGMMWAHYDQDRDTWQFTQDTGA